MDSPITTAVVKSLTLQHAETETPATQTPEPTPTNRDFSADIAVHPAKPPTPTIRTTRQFDLGNGTRLVDMRPSSGGLDVIPEGPGVNFRDVPTMSRRDAVLAALDFDGYTDEQRLALIRQIVTAPDTPAATR